MCKLVSVSMLRVLLNMRFSRVIGESSSVGMRLNMMLVVWFVGMIGGFV